MFSVDTVKNCECRNTCSNDCILKCCVNCCIAKLCPKHTKQKSDNILCNICGNQNELMNNYILLKDKKLVHYCIDCYDTHTDLLNYLILSFTEEEQYDKFVIKYKDSEKAITRYNIDVEKYNESIIKAAKNEKERKRQLKIDKIVDDFLEQYKNTVITEDILNNEIKTHKYYDHFDIINSFDHKYECPFCNEVVIFEETSICEWCDRISCDNCEMIKDIDCSNRSCSYCRSGNCHNNQIERYCHDCYVDDNLDFYNKYKDTIITSTILQREIQSLKLDELDNYDLKYKCPNCLITTDFKTDLIRCCDRCDKYICHNCSIVKNNGCAYYNCRFCRAGTCHYATFDIICNNCYGDNNGDEDEEQSESDNEPINQIIRCTSPCNLATEADAECNICYINEKKYACIPCGHMCMCGECANRILDKCPICKDNITDIIKIYL